MRIKICLIMVLLLGLVGLIFSLFIVNETDYVIVTQFGKPVRTIALPGLYCKRPGFLQTVNRFNKRVNTFKTQPIQLLLGDKNPLILTCYVCWRIADPLLFFQSVATAGIAAQKTGDMVSSRLGSVLGDYTINNVINTDTNAVKLAEMERRILADCNAKARQKYGIEIVSVGISRINYPAIVAEAVYKRMQAERKKEAVRFQAEGREEATKIHAETDREAARIMAEAYRAAEIIKGEGDKEAMTIYAKAFKQDPEFFEFIKSLDVYRRILKQKTTLILSTESSLFKYLKEPDGGKAK